MGLPPNLPLDLADDRPASVLSEIRSLSNWAREAKILNINSPEAVVVSIVPSWIDLNLIPLSFNPETIETKSFRDLPRRSSLHTTSTSPLDRVDIHFSSSGRSAFVPETSKAPIPHNENTPVFFVGKLNLNDKS